MEMSYVMGGTPNPVAIGDQFGTEIRGDLGLHFSDPDLGVTFKIIKISRISI